VDGGKDCKTNSIREIAIFWFFFSARMSTLWGKKEDEIIWGGK